MSIFDRILGRSLSNGACRKQGQTLSIITGVPALGLDALSSAAYGPEAALLVLLPLGVVGFHYYFLISSMVVVTLLLLYFSYLQTAAAYPNGGGAYVVVSDNLGKRMGVWAAVALLLDYLLNVAVGISAGVGAIVSAVPELHPYILEICLLVLFMLTVINLRGIRESGLAFVIPTLVFIACIGLSIVVGVFQSWVNDGHPIPIVAPTVVPAKTATLSYWLLLGAFANGLTAMTGVEAVSNAVPLFRKPTVRNAQWTLTIIVGLLGLFLLGLGYLCPSYQISAMDESQPGYRTILTQLVAAVFGEGPLYYVAIVSIFIVLTYSAQTSFMDFPRVCRLLAEDSFLPHFFADKGRRLVYSYGIIILSLVSAAILILFKAITMDLIPLFAIGAFSAFFFSQTGMIVYWVKQNKMKKHGFKLLFNILGAITTFIALIIIVSEKFAEGAWLIVVIALLLVILCFKIKRHYDKVTAEIQEPLQLDIFKLKSPAVIVPIEGWDRVAEKAIRFGLLMSDDVTVLMMTKDKEDKKHSIRNIWAKMVVKPAREAHAAIPHLEIVYSPYRQIYKPILDFVRKFKEKKTDRIIAVIIPELIEPHWYEQILHNLHAACLRTLLFLERDQRTVVITVPWYLREKPE